MSCTVKAAGIDTWSPAWYVAEGSGAERAMQALATKRSTRGWMIPEKLGGHNVGWFSASGLVYAEGHPGGPDALGCPDDLPAVLAALEAAIRDHGVPLPARRTRSIWRGDQTADRLPGFAGVRRLDATADLRFETAAEGLSTLAGVAALALPRMKSVTWREHGGPRLETVAFYGYSGKKMLGRWYDAGLHHGTSKRGEVIRMEDQRRFVREARRDVEELTSSYVRTKARQRFYPLYQASKGVTVANHLMLATRLQEAVEREDLTTREAELLTGYVLREAAGLPAPSARSRRRRRARIRDFGLVLADGVLEEVEVDLHEVLEQALDTDAWGRRG